MTQPTSHAEQHATFELDDIYCLECADTVVRALRAQAHISNVYLDWAHNGIHVTYHTDMITREAIEQVIASAGCRCAPADGVRDAGHSQVQPAPARRLERLRHGVDVQPITMGTKHDRMQYEQPATTARPSHTTPSGHAADHAAHPAMGHGEHAEMAHARPTEHPNASYEMTAIDRSEHAAIDHAAMGHDMVGMDHAALGHDMAGMDHAAMGHGMAGMDHAAMGHDMSDPGMAAAMERDMRTKFFIALPLTILTVLYAPLGMNLFGVRLPTFGLDMNLIMLALSTSVVFYSGWMFIAGAYQSLRRDMLNMSVLIATGVLAAYLFSLLITFIGGESFFEAAAMLITFVLFGH
jgi:cation transport ATPase